jgi:CheY-like chemotaxis protein
VLLIDDDCEFLDGMQRQLSDFCRALDVASTPLEALWLLERAAVDIVVCDLMLATSLGTDILERVRQSWPQTHRVLVTGYGNQVVGDDRVSSAHGVLLKPIDVWTLVGLFDELARCPVPQPPDASGVARSHARYAVSLPGRLELAGATRGVSIVELSLAGLVITHEASVAVGDRVAVAIELPAEQQHLRVGATVRWREGGRVGLHLEGTTAEQLAALNRLFVTVGGSSTAKDRD